MSSLTFAPPGPFARDIAQRARAVLQENGGSRFGDAAQWLRAASFMAFGIGAYLTLLFSHVPFMSAALLVAIVAQCAFMLIVQLGHDASHGSLARRSWINRLTVFTVFAIIGIDGALWRDRHIRLHHQVANLPGTGIDADSISLMRLAPDKEWHWWHRLQPLYGPLLYLIGHIHLVWFEDFREFRDARRAGRQEFLKAKAIPLFIAGKALHFTLFLALPALMLKPSGLDIAFFYVLASGVMTTSFVLLVVGTHISDLAAFPEPGEDGRVAHDWATHQVITSVDWSPTSKLAAFLSGGANGHVAHHLFPGYSHRHMAALSRIVADAARDHGMPYHVISFAEMGLAHWRHLVAMSREPA